MREPSKPPNGPERIADDSVDRRLRQALEPPPEAAGRIARRALSEAGADEERPARTFVVRPAVAIAGLALVAVALATLLLVLRLDPIERAAPEGSSASAARYSITNRGEVLVVQALDGAPSSLHSIRQSPERAPSPPGMRVLVLGGNRP